MKKIALLLAITCLSCAKDKLEIGRENPELEIQKCIALSNKKDYEKAVECLEIFKSRFPQTPQGQEAELRIADNYFNNREYLLAADTYQTFVRFHPFHPQIDYATYRTGLSYLKELPKAIDRDQQHLDSAMAQFEYVLRNFPESPYLEPAKKDLNESKRRKAHRNYYIGRFYYRTKEYKAAIGRFKEMIEIFPENRLNAKALYFLVVSHLGLGQKDEAYPFVTQLVGSYPETKWRKKAERELEKK